MIVPAGIKIVSGGHRYGPGDEIPDHLMKTIEADEKKQGSEKSETVAGAIKKQEEKLKLAEAEKSKSVTPAPAPAPVKPEK